MNWLDWVIIIALILTNVWTLRRFSFSSKNSVTDEQEVETLQDLVGRLAAETRLGGQRYTRLEQDYHAAIRELEQVRGQLERRTKALENCRQLLANRQGLEDSTP